MNRLSFPYIMWWAVCMHAAWGVALVFDPSISAIVVLVGLHWIIEAGLDGVMLGYLLVLVSVVAGVALCLGRRISSRTALMLVLPQQFLLISALISDSTTIITDRVNGQPAAFSQLILFTVLFPVMSAAVLHSAALIERHRAWNN